MEILICVAIGTLALIAVPLLSTIPLVHRLPFNISIAILLIISSTLVFLPEPDQRSDISTAFRVAGILLLFFLGLKAKPRHIALTARPPRYFGFFAVWVAVPLFAFIFCATIPDAQYGTFFLYGIVGSAGLLMLARGADLLAKIGALKPALIGALSVTLIASIYVGVFIPAYGIEQGRLRGVVENANTLGFLAFILASTSLIHTRRAFRFPIFVLCIVTLLWTASRASTLALLLLLLLYILAAPTIKKLAVSALFAIAFVLVAFADLPVFSGIGDLQLFRSGDSRSSSVDTGIYDWDRDFWFGVGYGNESSIIASSLFRALSNGGLFGAVAISVLCFGLVLVSLKANSRATAFAIAAVFHSFFEGWLLSPLGPLMLLFTLAWFTFLHAENENPKSACVTQNSVG